MGFFDMQHTSINPQFRHLKYESSVVAKICHFLTNPYHSLSKFTQYFPCFCSNIESRFLILLLNDVNNPHSKTELKKIMIVYPDKLFRDVSTNNASSGLRENVILTNLAGKYGAKIQLNI